MVRSLNKILSLIFIMFLTQCFTSCQKEPINGDLDGRWQILEIQIGESIHNVKDNQLYYGFSLHVCNLATYGDVFTEGNLLYKDDTILMEFPYIVTEEGLTKLETFGIFSNPVKFSVLLLNKNKLVLKEGDDVIITFRKF